MGRLIDANKHIEQIWQKHKEVEESYDLCVDELKEVFCGIVALVDEQPTAFDVDKVVEQLEDYANEEMHYYKGTPYEKCIEVCIGKAIEIVKGGGVDGN